MKLALVLSAFLLASAPVLASAAEIDGIPFADQVDVAGKKLSLNGLGLRQATFLHINVYAAGLYLEHPSHDAGEIDASAAPKHLVMIFMRDVGADKIRDAWPEGYDKNCTVGCEAGKTGILKLQAITEDMKKGERMVFDFYPDHVEATIKDSKPVNIVGKEFARNLLLCWIGKNPPNEGLRDGLLGKAQ
jgi:hypothetical protein